MDSINIGDKVVYVKQTHKYGVDEKLKIGMSGIVADMDDDFNLNIRVVFVIDGEPLSEWLSEDELELCK